jgi:DNA-binding NtrC family response regulator
MTETRKTILYLEDHDGLREALSDNLSFSGYNILQYSYCSSAIRDIKNGLKYDIALIDWEVGNKKDGESVMEVSKRINSNIPVISISGWTDKPKCADYSFDKSREDISKLLRLLKDAESFK